MRSLKVVLYEWQPTLIDGNSAEVQYISLAAYILLAVMWIIMIVANIHRYNNGGIVVSLAQMVVCALVSAVIYFIAPTIAPLALSAVALVGGGFLLMCMLQGTFEGVRNGEKEPRTLTDRHGVPVDYVFDDDGNRYYVDGRRIQDSEGRYVELHRDRNGNYEDPYGKHYESYN